MNDRRQRWDLQNRRARTQKPEWQLELRSQPRNPLPDQTIPALVLQTRLKAMMRSIENGDFPSTDRRLISRSLVPWIHEHAIDLKWVIRHTRDALQRLVQDSLAIDDIVDLAR